MLLSDIVDVLRTCGLLTGSSGDLSSAVTSVCDDSRRAVAGSLFIAVDGNDSDGHLFVENAVSRGAVGVVVQREMDVPFPQIVVSDSRRAAAVVAAHFFGQAGKHLRMIGVTGTNGKTTTVALARHILNGKADVGSIGTLGAYDGTGERLENVPRLTTPGPVDLQATLARLRDGGAGTVVMEVSSHALSQARVAEVRFDVAVFTNLTHEHFEYHRDLADYLNSKLKLLDHLTPEAQVVVNGDSTAWRQIALGRRDCISFSLTGGGTVNAFNVEPELGVTRFDLDIDGVGANVTLPLAGEFNVANALGAAAVGHALGMSVDEIAGRLAIAPQVPGRMEILYRGDFVVLRDYAHTPDAYDRVLSTLRKATPGRLMILFGCGGDRDRKKRSILASKACQLADMVFVTTDNPRTEDPAQIFQDMEHGLGSRAYLKIDDRADAIVRAIAMLAAGDTLLLAGKGHESYQLIGSERVPFDEKSIVAEALA